MNSYELAPETRALLASQRARSAAKREQVAVDFGSTEHFRNRLVLETIDRAEDPNLSKFYELYASVFVLEEEREPIDGFATVLAFNTVDGIQREFGPFYEPILTLRDPATNDLLAAANMTLYAYPELGPVYGFEASCQLHFLLVREDLRGLGLGGRLLTAVEALLAAFAGRHLGASNPRTFMTCEQNNPARMTSSQIEQDARVSLIDPLERMAWWRKRGFRRLDFSYVQPPLSVNHGPCTYLDYYAKRCNAASRDLASLPAPVLLEHVRRFFFVSVGKLSFDMSRNEEWLRTQSQLSLQPSIRLI